MPTVSHEVLLELVNLFSSRFNEDELQDLSFRLGVDYQNIPGSTKSAKARELAMFLNRRGLVGRLQEVGPQARPDLDEEWDRIFGTGEPPLLTPPGFTRVSGQELALVAQIVAGLPDFAAQIDRKTMVEVAGVEQYAAGIDLSGPERNVSLRLLTHLNRMASGAGGNTPLGMFLGYVLTLPDVRPDQQKTIQDVIAKYHL